MAMPDDMSEPEPLSTALAELPSLLLDTSRDPERRRRVDRIFWECAARGESVAALGQWACQHPSVFQELVFDARTFAARVRAARALHVLADGVRDETGLQMASALTSAVLNWFAHPEPMLWAVAGRALGRLSARVAIARDAIVGWSRSAHTWQRRRIALTLGTRPPDLEVWVEDEVAQILADREDGFRVAALGLAGPWLARDRPNVWAELLERAAGGEAELGWSVAQALAMLARGRGSQGLSESERTTARMLLATSTGFASRSSEEATRHFETALHSAQALAIGAATLPAVALLDQAIAGRFRAVGSVGTLLPLASIISSLESSDETGRGAAQFALRSMTRATCAELEDLAGGRHLPDVGELWETVENRLANDIHEFGQRATLVACLGDLADHGDHGASAARALHALARSRWAREAVVLAPEARGRAVALRRFRKPILDLLRRCAPTPDHQSQLPAAAAWWTISCGDAALMPLPSAPACIALQDAMRAATFGESPRVWGSAVTAALRVLGADDTLLARAVTTLASTLASISECACDEPELARTKFVELASAAEAMLQLVHDLDAALATGHVALGAPLGRFPEGNLEQVLQRWASGMPATLVEIVLPTARGLVDVIVRAGVLGRAPGRKIGAFELVERLGSGGMGEVWKARRGRQLVALKLPHSTAAAAVLSAESLQLEGLSLAKVATFIEAGIDGDTPYLATIYLRGRTLFEHALARDGVRMRESLARRIARDACIGLRNLEEVALVHRDVTPRNVFLRIRGRDPMPIPLLENDLDGDYIDEAVLLDLGLAQRTGEPATDQFSIGYVAPEILRREPVSAAADVYGLGASMFHVLTGQRFAQGLTTSEAIAWHTQMDPFEDPVVRSSSRMLPEPLADLLRAATRHDPALRPTLERIHAEL